MKIANPVKMEKTEIGNMLLVRAAKKREEVEKEGKQCEWHINRYVFIRNPEDTKERLGLTDNEYANWLIQF